MTCLNKKVELAKAVLEAIGDDPDNPWKDRPVDSLVFLWFQTGRQGDNLRLSEQGMRAFEYAKIKHFDFEFKKLDFDAWFDWTRYSLELSKRLNSPYYLGGSSNKITSNKVFIRIYDEKIAFTIILYGSIDDYMQTPEF